MGRLFFQNNKNEFYFEEGCFIQELLNDPSDPATSIARARVKPGDTTRLHQLKDTIERYVILEGYGEVEIDRQPAGKVTEGDVVVIPANTPQRISNTGNTDLIFLAICTPRFEYAAYQDIEESG